MRGSVDEQTQASGSLGKLEFQLRGVGVGGLQGREERSAGGGRRERTRGRRCRPGGLRAGRESVAHLWDGSGEVVVSSKRVRSVMR